jgi:putative flavoprotein involved in K+ transport
VAHLEGYARSFNAPVRLGVEVSSVEREPLTGRYTVETTDGPLMANNVIVAVGMFQQPKIPQMASRVPNQVLQIHSSEYRNADALPPGAVLVVGSGQSGAQIAEELYQAGRKVYLCIGSAGRIQRRYRGRDTVRWLDHIGFWKTVDELPSPAARFAGAPHVSGKAGGRTLNLHQFARDGVVLLGHLADVQDGKATLRPDMKESLAKADKLAADITKAIDQYILKAGLDVPEEPAAEGELLDGFQAEVVAELDLDAAAIGTIIWAAGYRFDFSWVRLPIFDEAGYPVQKRGVTAYPGLYFLGLPWLYSGYSGLLRGVGADAEHIAADLAARP